MKLTNKNLCYILILISIILSIIFIILLNNPDLIKDNKNTIGGTGIGIVLSILILTIGVWIKKITISGGYPYDTNVENFDRKEFIKYDPLYLDDKEQKLYRYKELDIYDEHKPYDITSYNYVKSNDYIKSINNLSVNIISKLLNNEELDNSAYIEDRLSIISKKSPIVNLKEKIPNPKNEYMIRVKNEAIDTIKQNVNKYEQLIKNKYTKEFIQTIKNIKDKLLRISQLKKENINKNTEYVNLYLKEKNKIRIFKKKFKKE